MCLRVKEGGTEFWYETYANGVCIDTCTVLYIVRAINVLKVKFICNIIAIVHINVI